MALYTREQLIEYASLTAEDLRKVKACRRVHNQLGFAYQVGFVRLLNRFPTQHPFELIEELLTFTGVQLHTNPKAISEYASRRETVAEHQARIRDYLNLKTLGPQEQHLLEVFLYGECFRLEHTSALRNQAQQFLKQHHILQPSTSTLDRLIGEQRTRARTQTFERMRSLLTPEVQATLEGLLETEHGKSPFNALKHVPLSASPGAIHKLINKLDVIKGSTVLELDLSWLNNNVQRSLARYARKASAHQISRLEARRRYTTLTAFLI